jgi:Mn2+/Fe2+ NRAMP family transporter
MKKILHLLLGIITSIAGFVEAGSLSTAAQAGSVFGFRLVWATVLAVVCVAFLVEMAGRLAAVSKHTVADAVREIFGFNFHAVPLTAEVFLDTLVLAAEIGGMCVGIQLLTAIGLRWWVLPSALLVWALLWYGTFGLIENGVSMLGLITGCFVVAAWKLHPPAGALAAGLVPTLPPDHRAQYGFMVVGILGATISPHLVNFYSSGAVQEKWGTKDLVSNRLTAALGMGFGGCVSLATLVVAAVVLQPRGIQVERFEQAALMLTPAFGRWGLWLFAAALFVGCLGAALEVACNLAFALAQAFGWNWSKDQKPRDDARFSVSYTVVILAATLVILSGIEPVRLTLFSMALTVVILPVVVFPFLVIMNDERYLKEHTNGWLSNAMVVFITAMGFVMALVAIPLQILGG